MSKTITSIDDKLYHYMIDTWSREPDIMRELRKETALKFDVSAMQISIDQAQFMAFMVKLMNAKNILEIGTFTGYSALAMALSSDENCKITCCDISKEWTDIAKQYWERAGVSQKIELKLAAAIDTLAQLQLDKKDHFDFAFIDADKSNYDNYYEACLKLIRPGGVIAIDNVFWGGWVADKTQHDQDTQAIRALNEKLQSDERIDLSIIPIGDGLTLAMKR